MADRRRLFPSDDSHFFPVMFNGLEADYLELDKTAIGDCSGYVTDHSHFSQDSFEISAYSAQRRISTASGEQALTPPKTPDDFENLYSTNQSRGSYQSMAESDSEYCPSPSEESSGQLDTRLMNQQQALPCVYPDVREGRQTRSMNRMQQQQQQQQQLQHSTSLPNYYSHPQWDQPFGSTQQSYFNPPAQQMRGGDDPMLGGDEDSYQPQGFNTQSVMQPTSSSVLRPHSPSSPTPSSSQNSEKSRKKYTLKTDLQRGDPNYKKHRAKNNASVNRTREKKKKEAEEEERRIKQLMTDKDQIIRILMENMDEDESTQLMNRMTPSQKSIFRGFHRNLFPSNN